MSPSPARRADAQRNYQSLLAAARVAFAEHGTGAPLDEIAKRAGVGNATMYRHFASRRELIIAVYADEVARLCAKGKDLLDHTDAGDALFVWLGEFIDHVAHKRDLALAVNDQRSVLFDEWHAAMRFTASALVDRAHKTGKLRTDAGVEDILALANGIALSGTDAEQTQRLIELVRQGVDRG